MKPMLPYRLFWLSTEEAYKDDIGSEIVLIPKDFEKVSYSFSSI